MPRISKDNKQYYKSKIRSMLVQDHQFTQRALQERLKLDGLDHDRKSLASLVNAIYVQRTKRADRANLNQALAAFEGGMTEVVRVAWRIANDPFARN